MVEHKEETLLKIKNLKVNINIRNRKAQILNDVHLEVRRGEILGIVGESGCGKSVTARTVIGLLPKQAEVVSGEVYFNNDNLLNKNPEEMSRIRANKIATIFQDPLTYLNPVLSIGTQIREAAKLGLSDSKQKISKKKLNELSIEALEMAGLPEPSSLLNKYPFELSGGMRQRVMIAMAIVRKPELIIADEITTALDVTTQARLLQNFRKLQSDINKTIIMVTHDMGVVAMVCDRVAVMYAGRVVEVGDVVELFENPKHPYTKALLNSIPKKHSKTLSYIPGQLPDYYQPPTGCRFHPRCEHVTNECKESDPELIRVTKEQQVACHLYSKEVKTIEEAT